MSLRPKTKRRLLILLGGGAAAAGLAAAGVEVQLHRHEAARQHIRAEGMAAFAHGDYRRTAVELQKYLNDNRTDPDAIYTLAVARSNLPEPDQAHLVAARDLLVRYLELRPGDLPAQHLLLDVYRRLRFRYETVQLADALLAKDPNDTAALSAKWQEFYRQGRLTDALATVERLDAVTPTDVRAQEATLELMARLHRPPAELVAHADALLTARPDDARAQLIRGVAATLAGDDAGARRWLSAAAAPRPRVDPALALGLADAYDRIGRWPDALAVVDRAAADAGRAAPAAVRVAVVERLWYAGQTARAVEHLADVSPSDLRTDVRLLGLKALLLDGTAGPTDAMVRPTTTPPARPAAADAAAVAAIRSALSARSDDPLAAGWAGLLRATDPDHPAVDARQAVTLATAAARADADSAAARFLLARAYLKLGETGLADEALGQSALLAPAWAAPRLLLAHALLDAGQPTAAAPLAQAAADRDPSSADARTTLAVVRYRTLGSKATADAIAPVLAAVQAARSRDPADPRLPAAAVDLLARSGRRADAVADARSYLNSPSVTAAGLYRVAAVAAVDQLDVASAVAARAAGLSVDSADAAYDVAMALSAAGQPDHGRQVVAAHPGDPAWQLAELRFREATAPSSPVLTDAWTALADANPNDLAIQLAALRSAAAGRSRPLLNRTIERVRTLTGDEAINWRLARARSQLAGDPSTAKDTANTVASSMAEVTRTVPHLAEPQVLWATALEQLGDPSAAAHLRAAVPLAPDDLNLPLRLARLLTARGEFGAAADALAPLAARAADLPPARAAEVADVYRQAGDADKAVALLGTATAGDSPTAELAVPLARAQATAGDVASAARTFDRVNASPAATVDSVRAAAWFYAGAGDVLRGRQTLARLDAMPAVTPVQRDVIRGQFTAAFGDPSDARSQLEAATRAAPDDPRPWAALAGFELHAGNDSAAVTAADKGLALAPDEGALSALRARAQTLATLHPGPAAQPLRDALAANPTHPAAVATLNALAAPSAAPAVAAVAQQYPTFMPAQALVIDQLVRGGEFDEAADVATRASDACPADPTPERLLLAVWTAAGRPDQALAAAQQWRDRSRAAPQAADTAAAAAQIRLGHPDAAVRTLAPYVRAHTTDAEATETYARALAVAGRGGEADAVLKPLAVAAPRRWRPAWLSVVADTAPSAADATGRIAGVERLLPPGSIADHTSAAAAWYTVSARFDDADAARRGLDELRPLTDPTTDVLVLTGALRQQLGQLPEAEASYRQAVTANPNLPRALNNLAWVTVLRNGDAGEARQLAERAVGLAPADADLRATVGQITLRQGDVAAATEAFRSAARLAPRSVAAWAGLADAQARAGHTGDAATALDRAEQLLQQQPASAPPPSRSTEAELQRARAALGRPNPGGPRTVRPVG